MTAVNLPSRGRVINEEQNTRARVDEQKRREDDAWEDDDDDDLDPFGLLEDTYDGNPTVQDLSLIHI